MSFDDAFDVTMGHEGGYVNDPDDPGGETYRGITHVHHPDWDGWDVIANGGLDAPELEQMVRDFYRTEYWTPWRGDDVATIAPEIASEIFDTGVNQGKRAAVQYLQDGLNQLNKNQKLYQDIKVDGQLGQLSLNALRHYLRTDEEELLYTVMNCLQGCFYSDIMRRRQTQEKYARGWFKRVTIHKRRPTI